MDPNEQISDTSTEVMQTEEQDMGDVYDRMMAENEPDERDRDERGRFKAKSVELDDDDGDDTAVAAAADDEADDQGDAEGDQEGDDTAESAENDDETEVSGEQAAAAPSYMPKGVRDVWGDIPAEAQAALSKSHLEMSTKLATFGRQAQALQPIMGEIQRATQSFPELANMTPDQVAADVFELAQTRANLQRDPVNTLLQVAQQTGVLQQLYQRMGHQPQDQSVETIALQQQVAQLQQQLSQQQNPVNVESVVQEQLQAQQTEQMVSAFAQSREHWSAVEADIPAFIPAAQHTLADGASYTDVLETAYNMAIDAKGLRASPKPAPNGTPAKGDPKRTEAAIKAKSVNVKSSSGKKTPKTEKQAMGDAYDRAMAG